MSLLRRIQARPFAVLAVVAVVWILSPVALRRLTRASFSAFGAPAELAASYARDLQQYWSLRTRSTRELLETARDLAKLNAQYELRIHENETLRTEINRLEDLLRLPSYPEYRTEVARIVRRDFNTWWQRLTVRKGRNYGLVAGAPVIFTGGVVGRVVEVDAVTAVVDLVSSPTLRLTASIEGDQRPFSYQGGPNPPFATPRGSVEFVPPDVTATPEYPKRIVTSGLGGIFPAGLTIGTITRLELDASGLFQVGSVLLDARLNEIDEVAVLVPLNPE